MWKLLFAVLIGVPSLAQTGDPTCFPRGSADERLGLGYTEREDGTLAAIDLQSGKAKWISGEASIPLLISAGRLMGADLHLESQRFFVAILDATTGASLARSPAIPLGGETDVPVRFHASLEGRLVHIDWQISGRYRTGIISQLQQNRPLVADRSHSVVVDPDSGGLVQGASPAQPAEPSAVPSTASVRYLRNAQWAQGPWMAGKVTADLIQSGTAEHPTFNLKITDPAGRARHDTSLGAVATVSAPVVTADGMYVLIPAGGSPGTWTVFNAATGALAGTATMPVGARDVCVLGARLYYVSAEPAKSSAQLTLEAFDLRQSRKLWEYSLGTRQTGRSPAIPQ